MFYYQIKIWVAKRKRNRTDQNNAPNKSTGRKVLSIQNMDKKLCTIRNLNIQYKIKSV